MIFRRIGGRIIPFREAAGFTAHKAVQETSAAMRSELKTAAAAKTSLANMRVKSVASVRKLLGAIDRYAGTKPKQIGSGTHMATYPAPGLYGWAVKVAHGNRTQVQERAMTKSVLSRHGLAPTTFHVQTKEKDYLVQRLGKTLNTAIAYRDEQGWRGRNETVDKLEQRIDQLGIQSYDLGLPNVARVRGKATSIDSGGFSWRRALSPSEIVRGLKFRISGRDYLPPLDQAKLFKGRKK